MDLRDYQTSLRNFIYCGNVYKHLFSCFIVIKFKDLFQYSGAYLCYTFENCYAQTHIYII